MYIDGCRYNERLNAETGGSRTTHIHWVTRVHTLYTHFHGALYFLGDSKKFPEKQKSSQIFIVRHNVTGGGKELTLSGKVVCLCACEH
jgi:hypothetical protein